MRLDDGRHEDQADRDRHAGARRLPRGPGNRSGARLADDERVVLCGDPTQDPRDRYGRLLAYAWARGRDVGFQQVSSSLARVYVYDRPFQRLDAYRRAERVGRALARNVWRGCSSPALRKSPAKWDPSYPGVCIPPPPPDLDCAQVPVSGFAVRGLDPHSFDGDGDGVGCEG